MAKFVALLKDAHDTLMWFELVKLDTIYLQKMTLIVIIPHYAEAKKGTLIVMAILNTYIGFIMTLYVII